MTRFSIALAAAAIACAGTVGASQAPPAGRPDSPEVRARLDALKTTAGDQWAEAVEFICAPDPSRANRPDDPVIEPARIFDNLFVVGRTSTVVWIVVTSAGIVLVDAGYPDQLDSVLLAGMKALGIDPARVTHVIVAHGHADHYGGAPYFQQRGARVLMGAPDWDLLDAAPGAAGPAASAPQAPRLRRDIAVMDGDTLTVGDVTFSFALVPGHTPGSLGVVFPVKDGNTIRTAGLFGGSILMPGRIPDAGLRQYVASIEHWARMTEALHVDVEIQNHPMYDGFASRLQRLQQRRPGEPNPFVVGRDGYQRFLQIMSGCTNVQLARRAGA